MTDKTKIAVDLDRVLAPYITAVLPFIKPYPDSIDSVTKLSEKYNLVVVTARHPFFRKTTIKWINKYFPDVFDSILFLNYKTIFGPRDLKSKLCLDNGISAIIDDKIKNVLDCHSHDIKAYLFGVHSRSSKLPSGIKTVSSWPETLSELM